MKKSKLPTILKAILFPCISIFCFLLIWQIGVSTTSLGNVLAGPFPVIREFVMGFVKPIGKYTMPIHIFWSMKRVIPAYLFGSFSGVLIGILMGWYPMINAIFRPFYNLLRPIPPIAWIPLAILWFGIGDASKYFLIFLAAFMPIVMNSCAGVISVDPTLIKCGQMLGASNGQIFLTVVIPASVPYIFAGLQVGLSGAWATIVAAEMIRSTEGIGWIIVTSQDTNNSVQTLVGIIAIGLMGYILAVIMRKLEEVLCRWNRREI